MRAAVEGVSHVLHGATCKETPEDVIDVTIKALFRLPEEWRVRPSFQRIILIGGDVALGYAVGRLLLLKFETQHFVDWDAWDGGLHPACWCSPCGQRGTSNHRSCRRGVNRQVHSHRDVGQGNGVLVVIGIAGRMTQRREIHDMDEVPLLVSAFRLSRLVGQRDFGTERGVGLDQREGE